jgi:UDP-2,4-diacetamido-2,4,6-trideoxy-beta-L-altropyranose hydrolase
MKVAFRADASLTIGTGHVMRCLTLARELAARGHECRFLCRDLPGGLGALVAAEFPLALLRAPDGPAPDGPPAHAAWAGVSWQRDAAETRTAAGVADWLVVDHYAFDARWQRAARPAGARVMVLDDLADRPHDCDLLLDQNLGRDGADYDAMLPDHAERLIGPRYALLRPEFAAARPAALARRGGPLRHLLIAPGGVDAGNVTGLCLTALATLPLPDGFRVTVALGPTAPHLAALRAMALPFACTVLAGADMAALMSDADLCIGAAGGSAWERCALGLPTLQLVLAENQRTGAEALAIAGAALPLGTPDEGLPQRLATAFVTLADPAQRAAIAKAAARITDGRGAARVADALECPLALRAATLADAEAVWHWRAALPAAHFRAGPNPPLADHLRWWAKALHSPDRLLLMAGTLAHLRLDRTGDSATVSILLAPKARGRGLGLRLLALLEPMARHHGLRHLTAEAAADNPASVALFRAAGYADTGLAQGFHHFTRPLQSLPRSVTSAAQEAP